MCTVTFLPLPGGGYLLATNRDESPRRGPARPPRALTRSGRELLAPLDSDAGGTWVAVDGEGSTLCILNGDRPPAAPPPADAPSRGLLVLELMEDPRADVVVERLERRRAADQLRSRPFKLLVAEDGADGARLARVDWDGRDLLVQRLAGPAVAVSSTYQSQAVAASREALFGGLLSDVATGPATREGWQALQWRWHAAHRDVAPAGDAHSVCMHRPDARTVSCTLVSVGLDQVGMIYQPGHPCQASPSVEVSLPRRQLSG